MVVTQYLLAYSNEELALRVWFLTDTSEISPWWCDPAPHNMIFCSCLSTCSIIFWSVDLPIYACSFLIFTPCCIKKSLVSFMNIIIMIHRNINRPNIVFSQGTSVIGSRPGCTDKTWSNDTHFPGVSWSSFLIFYKFFLYH